MGSYDLFPINNIGISLSIFLPFAASELNVRCIVEEIISFVITLYVREGIVMASDSRLTLNTQNQQGQNQIVNLAVGQSDSNYKTFLSPSNIGISNYGAADIGGTPIGGYIIGDVLHIYIFEM